MSKNSRLFRRVSELFEVVGSAAAMARAVRSGRMPQDRDLETLGMDPELFRSIGRP